MTRKPYVRPMRGWWRRDPYFTRYMAREATAVLVVAYAAILLVTIERLAQGRDAFEAWMELLRGGAFLALHVAIVATFVLHTVTWFAIMPKTMPPVEVAGRRLGPAAITGAGLVASLAASVMLFLTLRHLAS